jgi:hypothetical protein
MDNIPAERLEGRPPQVSYTPNYSWLKLDAFNPADKPLAVSVAGVPLVLQPGSNIVPVKLSDRNSPDMGSFPVTCRETNPAVLFLDNARVEQEAPKIIREKGWLFHFLGKGAGYKDDRPSERDMSRMVWPGCRLVDHGQPYSPEKKYGWLGAPGHMNAWNNRIREPSLVFGGTHAGNAKFRVDVPNGRYGLVFITAVPLYFEHQLREVRATVNGNQYVLIKGRTAAEVRQDALAGQLWDYRPGACVWQALVQPWYVRVAEPITVDVTNGCLLIEKTQMHGLMIFPEADREAALQEVGRLNYLLADSWDHSHCWVFGAWAKATGFTGWHDEAADPGGIPKRIAALNLKEKDYERGFLLFQRGLTEPVYADSIPTPEEAAVKELRCLAAPGGTECVTLGILPLKEMRGLKIAAGDLRGGGENKIPAEKLDLRVSRMHQAAMNFGHHNQMYNLVEYYLLHRSVLDLFPAAAKRVYLDIKVDPEVQPGEYRGELALADAGGKILAAVPLVVEVLPIALAEPPVRFGGSFSGYIPKDGWAVLKGYGFNALGGLAATNAVAYNLPPLGDHLVELEGIRVGAIVPATTQSLAQAALSGKEYWLIDGIKTTKEQEARFTFGFWLWRFGAAGRYTGLGAGALLDHGWPYNPGWPYYSHVGTACDNVYCALAPDLATTNAWNPCRDLVLLRAGIADYRYLYTLDRLLAQAREKKPANAAVKAAAEFRANLWNEIVLDLKEYYNPRAGSYAQDWFVKPGNPWVGAKFDQTRRQAADHILALQQVLKKQE